MIVVTSRYQNAKYLFVIDDAKKLIRFELIQASLFHESDFSTEQKFYYRYERPRKRPRKYRPLFLSIEAKGSGTKSKLKLPIPMVQKILDLGKTNGF